MIRHHSNRWQFTADHHSPEGQERIRLLKAEIRKQNKRSTFKHTVKLFGRAEDRRELERECGVPPYTWKECSPPLHVAPLVDVYVYPDYRRNKR